MQTMQPVIVFGSYMLDEELIPVDEFELRVRSVQSVMAGNGWSGLIAYGDPLENAVLTYTTNYAPRNRPAIALIPPDGDPRMLVSASPRDIKREASLAWMDDVRMIGNLGDSLGAWLDDAGIDIGTVALIGGANMRPPAFDATTEACVSRGLKIANADAAMAALLHRKRPREMVVVRRAAGILTETAESLSAAWKSGATASEAVLAAEKAAFTLQALDARTLFSIDGGRTLRPYEWPMQDRPKRLAVYVAVRYQAYWAEAFVTLSPRRSKIQIAAGDALARMIAAAGPGVTGAELQIAAGPPGPYKTHPAIGASLGHGIGLSLSEMPDLSPGNSDAMIENGTYSLTVGLSEGRRNHALTSAMVALGPDGAEVLWRMPRP